VNLSDLAACGAQPLAFTLALSMPQVDPGWIDAFSRGLFALADSHDCELVGGDTTRGPLNICITVFGEVPPGGALLRSGARVGDDLYVSGTLGDARLALEVFRGRVAVGADVFDSARARMEQPTPRTALGVALRGIATSAADVSDGLLGDLRHILQASCVAAVIDAPAAAALMTNGAHVDAGQRLEFTLAGGDDYELVFTAPRERADAVARAAQGSGTRVSRIGRIESGSGVRLVDADGTQLPNRYDSFDHFA
jgi:thiamine-monophosphate kinase